MLQMKGNENLLIVTLPEGKTNQELLELLKTELKAMEPSFYGMELKITGRVTTPMCLYLGHVLAHICKSVSIFDPKQNEYILCIAH